MVGLTEQDLELNSAARDSLTSVFSEANNVMNASDEQKLALDEVAKSIAVINGTTQTIAIGAQDLTTTSKNLADMALRLMTMAEG